MPFIGQSPPSVALTSSDITDGIISNAKLAQDIISADTALGATPADTDEFLVSDAGTLKRMDYSYIKASGGLAEVSQYRMGGSTIAVSATTSTLLDNAFAEVYKVGTGMTYSSGVWTFPSTGIWRIELCLTLLAQSSGGDCRYAGGQIHTTPDDSTYTNVANVYTNANWISSNWYMGTHSDVFFDVTSTSTHKVKFFAYSAVQTATEQSTNANRTYATFTRLGDT